MADSFKEELESINGDVSFVGIMGTMERESKIGDGE